MTITPREIDELESARISLEIERLDKEIAEIDLRMLIYDVMEAQASILFFVLSKAPSPECIREAEAGRQLLLNHGIKESTLASYDEMWTRCLQLRHREVTH